MKKKILSVALVLTMALSMSACGNKAKAGNKVSVTVDEVQSKMTEAIKEVDSVDMDLDVAVGVKATGEEASQNMSIELNADAEVKAIIDNPAGYAKYSLDMKAKGDSDNMENKMSGEAYLVSDKEEASLYYNTDDEGWYKGTTTVEELKAEFESALSDYGMSMDELMNSFTEEGTTEGQKPELAGKTVEAEGKECYELTVSMNKDTLASVEEAASYAEMFETFDGSLKMYVDVDTNLPVKVVCDLDLKMDMYGTTIEIDKFDFEITADYNNVKNIEVPSKVKDSAVDVSE